MLILLLLIALLGTGLLMNRYIETEKRRELRILMEAKYRHEYKYICDAVQSSIIKMRANGLLALDKNACENGYYNIRSLYFDTLDNRCYYENEMGVDNRSKFRVRIYDHCMEKILLEKKSKRRQMTLKKSCCISKSDCEKLMNQEKVEITEDMTSTQKQLLTELQIQNMRPVVIVEYDRVPFVNSSGNVRVTFDENIRSSNDVGSFLEEDIQTRPIMEKGKSILEIKWDEFLPSYIKTHLQTECLQWSSFSKYYLCRKYNTYGGIKL